MKKMETRYKKKLMIHAIHVFLLLLAVLVVRHSVTPETALFIICSVYVSSVFFIWYEIFSILPTIITFVVVYRCNPRDMIYGKLTKKKPLMKVLLWLYGDKVKATALDTILENARPIILITVAIFLLHHIVTPNVIRLTTDMSWIELLLYPFLFSYDHLSSIDLFRELESLPTALSSMISGFFHVISSTATKTWTGLKSIVGS